MTEAAPSAVAPPTEPPRAPGWRDRVRSLRARSRGVRVGERVVLGRGVRFDLAAGASVELSDGAVIGERCRFHVGPGAVVRIGARAVLGARCAVVARVGIDVGARAMLADEVVVVDAEARLDDVERPVRLQGLQAEAVVIGEGARLGPGAVVQRGVTVGPGAVVAAHAVVTAAVAPGAVVDGVPAGCGGRDAIAPRVPPGGGVRRAVAPRSDGRGGAGLPPDR